MSGKESNNQIKASYEDKELFNGKVAQILSLQELARKERLASASQLMTTL